jgi:hypothetical protein
MPSEYDKQVQALIAEAERRMETTVVKAIKQLDIARKQIFATAAETRWELYNLPHLKTAINKAMADFAARFGSELSADQKEFWSFGQMIVDETLKTVRISIFLPAIDTEMLIAIQSYSTHLVNSLGADAAAKIYNEFASGLIGQKTPFEVMQAVGTNLNDKGIFNSIAARAETITRQETGRALSEASQARMERAAEVVPGLNKQWQHGASSMPRSGHKAMQGQVREVNKPFDIPTYSVGKRVCPTEQLMYPRDMNGSPENTINCSCYSVPYMAEWTKKQPEAAENANEGKDKG